MMAKQGMPKGDSSAEKLNESLDSTIKRLETLEGLVNENPEYAEYAPYLRIAMASLRTAKGLYGVPIKIAADAKELASEKTGDNVS